MKIRYAAKTDVGMKRNHNEDYFSLIEDEQLFIVADGMGGHAAGEVASKTAVDTLREFIEATAGMYGDLQGIAGKTLKEIEGLDVRLLDVGER